MKISQPDREDMVPSGVQARYENRISWATYYLKRAGLLETIKRGIYKITDSGVKVLKDKPATINIKFLRQFDEFVEFENLSNKSNKSTDKSEIDDIENRIATPDELIEKAWSELYQTLIADVKEALHKVRTSKI